jgi:hypothetical protein
MKLTPAERLWEGLVLPAAPRPCHRCKTALNTDRISVLDDEDRWYHPHCASYLGWVPSDTEAWAFALYNCAIQPEGGH